MSDIHVDDSSLGEGTKVFIFLVTVIATEFGSNVGLYMAMLVWLELDRIVAIEQRILEYINKTRKGGET